MKFVHRIVPFLIPACLAAAAALTGASAQASCADPRSATATQPRITLPARADAATANPLGARSIVGTWLVTYATDGVPGPQAFIQWHADGTEWENINLPISAGTICMGSWKAIDAKHVERNHYGWLYTDGALSGYFNETETATIGPGNAYAGVTQTEFYDLAGGLLVQTSGTSSAVRIAP